MPGLPRVYNIEDLESVIREIEVGAGLRITPKKEVRKLIVRHMEDEQ